MIGPRQHYRRIASGADSRSSVPAIYAWLLVVVFFEYARPASFLSGLGVLRLNTVLPLGLLIACIWAQAVRPLKEMFADGVAWWLLAYLVLISLGILHADITVRAFNTFKTCLGYGLLAFMIARVCTSRRRVLGVFAALILSHLFLVAMNPAVITDPATRNWIHGATFLGDGNDFALSASMLVPMSIALAGSMRGKTAKLFWAGTAVAIVVAIVGTSSRGAALSLAALAIFYLTTSRRRVVAMMAIVIAAAGVVMYAPAAYFNRVKTIATYEEDTSATGRIEAWKAGARMGAANPALGVGAGNFPNSFPRYRGPDAPVRWMTAHSMYVLVFAELGVSGLIVLLAIVPGSVAANMRLRRRLLTGLYAHEGKSIDAALLAGLAASGVALAVGGAFLSVSYYPHLFVLGALGIAARSVVRVSMAGRTDGPVRTRRFQGKEQPEGERQFREP